MHRAIALVVVACLAAGDSITYCTPGAFLGHALAAQGATPSQVMLAYGLFGATTATTCILVLLCQSVPAVSGLTPASKWSIVVVAQSVSVASSVIILVWPVTSSVMAARALHGAAAAFYLVYCLSLLVELSPKQHLATGIAAMAAGITTGDSSAAVIGAIIYDRAGLRAAFLLPAAFGTLVLLLALLMFPLWQWGHTNRKHNTKHRSHSSSCSSMLLRLPQKLDVITGASWTGGAALSLSRSQHTYPTQPSATDQQPQPIPESISKDFSIAAAASAFGHQSQPDTKMILTNSVSPKDPCCIEPASLTRNKPSSCSYSTSPTVQGTDYLRSKLDFSSVASAVRDPVVFCQCLVLFLEQTVRATITVVLPATMGTAMWLVGVVYVANVVGAVISPLAVDYIITRVPEIHTHLLAASLSLVMCVSSILSVAFSTKIALLCVLLFVYGCSQSSVGTLVYVHVARRQDVIGHHTGLHVSMCMYVFADFAAGGLGNLTGGALQHQVWGMQLGVVALVAALATCFGVAVGLTSYVHDKNHREGDIGDSQVIIEESPVDHLSQVIIEQSVALA